MNISNLLTLFLVFLSCNSEINNFNEKVNIRVMNSSDFDYKDIRINTSAGTVKYGNLDSKKTSEYKSFELVYGQASIELTIEGKIYTLPSQAILEPPLMNGSYTYAISADISNRYDTLSLDLIYETEPAKNNSKN